MELFALSLEDKGQKKLLAINFGGLGDEVLFLPALKSIKLRHPTWHLTLLTEPRARSIIQVTNLVDANITFDIKKRPLKVQDYLELVGLLRNGKFDMVVSSGSSPQVAGLLFLSGIPKRVGYGSNGLARMLLTDPVPLERNQHASLMYHDLTKGLAVVDTASRPEVSVDRASRSKMATYLLGTASDTTAAAAKTVIIHPGTSKLATEKGIIKTWDPQNWAALIHRLIEQKKVRVILAGGPDDESTIAEIVRLLPSMGALPPGLFVNAFGQTANLADLVSLIDISDLLICVDSAPMHIGVGLDKNMVALFGPTDPAKLLWPSPNFSAIRDAEAAKFWAGKDPFMQPRGSSAEQAQRQPEPFVLIPLDTVYQTAVDRLS